MKKVFIITLKILTIAMALALILSGCQKRKPKDIEVIFVRNYFIENYYEDKIDFNNKQHWKAGPINRSQKVEDYIFVCDLEDEKITDFLNAIKEYELLSWEGEYRLTGEYHDGHQWSINIIFSDSTSTGAYGDNNYPETYDEIREALENLTGSIILDEKSGLYKRRYPD